MSKVGVALNNGSHIWYERQVQAEREVVKAAGHDLEVFDAEDSPDRQVSQIEELIDGGAEVLVVSATRADAIDSALDAAVHEQIPVITESVAVDHPAVTVQVKADDLEIGRMLGAAVAESLPFDGVLELVSFGFPELEEANRREWGFMAGLRTRHADTRSVYLDSKAQIPIARTVGARWAQERAFQQPHLVMGVDDEALIGGLEGLRNAGVDLDGVTTAAFGISPPSGPAHLDDGTITYGAAMFPELHGTIIGELATALLAGKKVPGVVSPPGAVVTASGTSRSWTRFYERKAGDFRLDIDAARSQ